MKRGLQQRVVSDPREKTMATTTTPTPISSQKRPSSLISSASASGPQPTPEETGQAGGSGQHVSMLPPLDRGDRQLSERKLRRLEMNRLSARECRRKKKIQTAAMKKEIVQLEAENLHLRLQLQVGKEADETFKKAEEQLASDLGELLKSGASESDLRAIVSDFNERFTDWGLDKRSSVEFHLRNCARLLQPNTVTSVAVHTLYGLAGMGEEGKVSSTSESSSGSSSSSSSSSSSASASATQSSLSSSSSSFSSSSSSAHHHGERVASSATAPDPEVSSANHTKSIREGEFAAPAVSVHSCTRATASAPPSNEHTHSGDNDSSNTKFTDPNIMSVLSSPTSLSRFLEDFLDMDQEQRAQLRKSHQLARELHESLEESLKALNELRGKLLAMGKDLVSSIGEIKSVLNPSQSAKFLVWVANNSACMHMLNEMWSKFYRGTPVDDKTIEIKVADEYDTDQEEVKGGAQDDGDEDDLVPSTSVHVSGNGATDTGDKKRQRL